MKSCLNVSLRNKTLTEEEFCTVVEECQAVVSNRPLTYLSNDVQDEPLTPSHLLRGTMVETLPLIPAAEPREDDDVNVGKRVRHQCVLFMQELKTFQSRWRSEYLTSLRQRHYNGCSKQQGYHLRQGELVLLQYPGSAKSNWPLAKVIEVYPNDRGKVRSVKVSCQGEEYVRAVEYLIPLELSCEATEEEESPPRDDGNQEDVHVSEEDVDEEVHIADDVSED